MCTRAFDFETAQAPHCLNWLSNRNSKGFGKLREGFGIWVALTGLEGFLGSEWVWSWLGLGGFDAIKIGGRMGLGSGRGLTFD